tara:strand:- start:171 stop:608 length:438 start_codon:yes stop_codon:yes gene_type:complete
MNYIDKTENINVDVNTIFTLINNVDGYKDFLPWCKNSSIESNIDNIIVGEIEISKNLISWKFKTSNHYIEDKKIELKLVDGPFSHLKGEWNFKKKDNFNTQVNLYLEYQFDNRIIEMSLKPIFSSIMNSILDSFISEAFRIKNEK